MLRGVVRDFSQQYIVSKAIVGFVVVRKPTAIDVIDVDQQSALIQVLLV